MPETPFYKTRMGQVFYERTVPALVQAVERLAEGAASDKRDPAVKELADCAAHLAHAAETMLDTEIVAGSPRTREAFDALRANAAAVRRILAQIG